MISFQYMLNNAPTNDWYGRKPFDMPYNNVTHRKCTHSESATQKEETVNEHDRHRELTKSHTNTRTHTQIHSHAMHTDASMRTRFVHLKRMGKRATSSDKHFLCVHFKFYTSFNVQIETYSPQELQCELKIAASEMAHPSKRERKSHCAIKLNNPKSMSIGKLVFRRVLVWVHWACDRCFFCCFYFILSLSTQFECIPIRFGVLCVCSSISVRCVWIGFTAHLCVLCHEFGRPTFMFNFSIGLSNENGWCVLFTNSVNSAYNIVLSRLQLDFLFYSVFSSFVF